MRGQPLAAQVLERGPGGWRHRASYHAIACPGAGLNQGACGAGHQLGFQPLALDGGLVLFLVAGYKRHGQRQDAKRGAAPNCDERIGGAIGAARKNIEKRDVAWERASAICSIQPGQIFAIAQAPDFGEVEPPRPASLIRDGDLAGGDPLADGARRDAENIGDVPDSPECVVPVCPAGASHGPHQWI